VQRTIKAAFYAPGRAAEALQDTAVFNVAQRALAQAAAAASSSSSGSAASLRVLLKRSAAAPARVLHALFAGVADEAQRRAAKPPPLK
jgi:hypothetical protein